MLRKNENLHSGFNQICDGEKDQMFMNIQLLIGRQGESWPVQSEDQETALLLLSGKVTFHYADQTVTAQRQNCFRDDATCLHVCRNTPVTLVFEEDGEVLVQQKENPRIFPAVLYDKSNIDKQFFGEGKLAATTRRSRRSWITSERRIPTWCWEKSPTFRVFGAVIRRIIILSRRSTSTNLIIRRASAAASWVRTSIKSRTTASR